MIVLDDSLFAYLDGTVEGLRLALQAAIRLEHGTVPTYLYTLYSIKNGYNRAAQQIIRSVVMEEMLHMTVACNLLNAIGGSPVIADPGFPMQYPGSLPGGVQNGLQVNLAPLSLDHIGEVFMGIEQPEDPLNFPTGVQNPPKTIGMYYEGICNQLQESFFTGDPARQVVVNWWPSTELFPVTDLASAKRAIGIIVEQGEGTTETPEDQAAEYAHYYRFAEIFHGNRLIKNPNATPSTPPDERFLYGGDPVPLDPTGVQQLLINPKAGLYPADSPAAVANDAFNATYTTLLRSLQVVFTGQPQRLGSAIGIMESLKEQALTLTGISVGLGLFAGPTFEWRAVN